jgi:oligoendopeptidase F
VDTLRREYRKLLDAYFGPDFVIDKELELECLRIPHFYRAFYVYKYATGLSAAIALSQRVLNGGERELNDYLGFLKGGGSNFPLELLRGAGVDMEKPEAVDTALAHFGRLVEELEELLEGGALDGLKGKEAGRNGSSGNGRHRGNGKAGKAKR